MEQGNVPFRLYITGSVPRQVTHPRAQEEQFFADVPDGYGGTIPWGNDIWRVDIAAGYRFTPHAQLKLQYSFQKETSGPGDDNHLIAAQFTLRF